MTFTPSEVSRDLFGLNLKNETLASCIVIDAYFWHKIHPDRNPIKAPIKKIDW